MRNIYCFFSWTTFRTLITSAILAMACFTLAPSAVAAPILVRSGSVYAVAGQNTEKFDNRAQSNDIGISVIGTATGFGAIATSDTQFRMNHARASANKAVEDGFSQAQARSYWQDEIIVTGWPGPIARVGFVFTISGSLSAPDDADASAAFSFTYDLNDDTCCSDEVSVGWVYPEQASEEEVFLIADVEVNTLVEVSMELVVTAVVGRGDVGESTADFWSTAILTEVVLPEGATISATSGTDYMAPAVVPVPAALWLFGSALGLFGLMRQK